MVMAMRPDRESHATPVSANGLRDARSLSVRDRTYFI